MNYVSQDAAYPRLKDYLIASTGLAFYSDRDQQITQLIGGRLSALGLPGCSAYAELLADGAKGRMEMEVVISHLTIGESYFFRDEDQFAALREVIVPDIQERQRASKRLRIWSAGCATGAEPYSLSILLMHGLAAQTAGWRVDIFASDLNRGFLAQARAGKFRTSALRATPVAVRDECFTREGKDWVLHPRFKEWVSFHHLNLVAGEFALPFSAPDRFDLILCRNVMIYFAPEVRRRLIQRFHRSLTAGGWLLVGGSESDLESYQAFQAVSVSGAKLYRKGNPVEVPPPPVPGPRVLLTAPRPAAASTPAVEPHPAAIEGLRQLVDRGDWTGAAECSREMLRKDPLNPQIHFYQALIFENLGIAGQAEKSLRHAIYLDRNFALAHYHLGLALKRNAKAGLAEQSFENVLRVLDALPQHALITAGPGVTVTRLKELAKMHLTQAGRPV